MTWFWTWSGKCFGYRSGDNLFTTSGNNVGYFVDEEVYACDDGRYLGEIKNDKFLITNQSKKHNQHSPRAQVVGGSYAKYVDYVGYVMYAGYEDFPEFE